MSPTKTTSPDKPERLKKDGLAATNDLPVAHPLKLGYLFSLLIVVLTVIASVAGLLYPDDLYPTEALRQSSVANDIVNLAIGIPILLGSMWLAWRGKLIGLLFWPGAVFYGLYNYFIYLFGNPFNVMFPVYLVIVTLSIYITIGLVASVDGQAVKQRLAGRVPEKLAGGILTAFGILFMLLAASEMIDPLVNQAVITRPELGLVVADFIMSGAMVIGGVLLWRRQALGYVGGTGLLFLASMLFIGLIALMLLMPLLSDAALAIMDILFVLIMSLICFIPFGLFVRGVVKG